MSTVPHPGETALARLLVNLCDPLGLEPQEPAMDRIMAEACRLLRADLAYTVLPSEGAWTRVGYSSDGRRGAMTLTRPTGIARQVLARRARFIQDRGVSHGAFNRRQDGWPGIDTASFLAVPIHRLGRTRGVLVLLRTSAHPPFQAEEFEASEILAEAIGVREACEERLAELHALARTDGLTQIPNYRSARELLQREIASARRLGETLSLLLVDVDDLKGINERYGFLVGSEVVARVGKIVARAVRGSDHVARLGGDEFLVLLPDTPVEGARCAAERIRRVVASELNGAGGLPAVTCAASVAVVPEHGSDYASLISTLGRGLCSPAAGRDGRESPLDRASARAGLCYDETSKGVSSRGSHVSPNSRSLSARPSARHPY